MTSLADLKPDPRNARKHNPRNIGAITDSLHKVGAARSIVIDENNVILAGNGLVEAAGIAGIENVQIVEADGKTVIAVRRTGLTKKQKAELAIYDNRTAELAEWDVPVLTGLADEVGLDLTSVDFTPEEISKLGDDWMRENGEVVEDEVPAASDVEKRCNAGDLWTLGTHRLLCGDSTKLEDVTRVLGGATPLIMVSDPPYGVNLDQSWRDKALGSKAMGPGNKRVVQNDNKADWSETYELFTGDIVYIWHASKFSDVVMAGLRASGFEVCQQLIWNKSVMVMGRSDYHFKHEPCWYAVRKGKTHKWTGDRKQTTVIEAASPNHIMSGSDEEKTEHPTQKPVECMARPIRNHGGKNDDVYDPFLGSGTTLIAAEQLGRRCFGIEISPTYCDVILARWEKLTGKKAERVEPKPAQAA